MKKIIYFFLFFAFPLFGELYLRDVMKCAPSGDYIVTQQGRNLSLLHIVSNNQKVILFEEITAPGSLNPDSWRSWVREGAPEHTSWVMYKIDLETGRLFDIYSFTRQSYLDISDAENILSTLVNLPFEQLAPSQRKKVGRPVRGKNTFWQPRMVVDGSEIRGVEFEAFRTSWPKDGSDLSGKTIEMYLPSEEGPYPSYFPYWIQISGVIGKAKLRIIDSGKGLKNGPETSYQQDAYQGS